MKFSNMLLLYAFLCYWEASMKNTLRVAFESAETLLILVSEKNYIKQLCPNIFTHPIFPALLVEQEKSIITFDN